MNKQTYVILFLVFAAVGATVFFFLTPFEPAGYHVPRQITYRFRVQNRTNQVQTGGRLRVHAPAGQTAGQTTTNLDATQPFELLEDPSGNRTLVFALDNIPPFGTRIIQVTADLLMAETAIKRLQRPDPVYLSPEPFVESDHPAVKETAGRLKGRTDRETVENIYRFVSRHIRYAGHVRHNRGAVYALKRKKGDCTEFAVLFTALARASNLPARYVGGYVCHGNCIVSPRDYHNWAEVFLNNSWQIVDCQKKVFLSNTDNYLTMKIFPSAADSQLNAFDKFRVSNSEMGVAMY